MIQIFLGSESDVEKVKELSDVLDELKIEYEVNIFSAHRNLEALQTFIKETDYFDIEVVIAAAGWAAALPGIVSSIFVEHFIKGQLEYLIPVIGIPLSSTEYPDAHDATISMLRMPPGIPVLVIPNPKNAAIAAVQILAASGLPTTTDRFTKYLRENQKTAIPEFKVSSHEEE